MKQNYSLRKPERFSNVCFQLDSREKALQNDLESKKTVWRHQIGISEEQTEESGKSGVKDKINSKEKKIDNKKERTKRYEKRIQAI